MRFLDSGRVRRLGGVEEKIVDLRIIASTSVDLVAAVEGGSFRADLFFRLRRAEVELPPLRQRRSDVPLLFKHFLERHAPRWNLPVPFPSEGILRRLQEHHWPGNVRELENLALRLLIDKLSPGHVSEEETDWRLIEGYLGGAARQRFDPALFEGTNLKDLARDLEREYLVDLFRRTRGDPEQMMERLGVKKSQLYAWFRRLGVDVKALRRRL